MIEALPVVTTQYPALLPEGVALVDVARPHNAAVARREGEEPQTVAVFVQHAARPGRPAATDLVRIGCAALVEEVVRADGQLLGLRVRGLARVELLELTDEGPALAAQVRVHDAPAAPDPFLAAQFARVKARLAGDGLSLEPGVREALAGIEDPGRYADVLVAGLDLTLEQRLALLTATWPAARLEVVDRLLGERLPAPTTELGQVWAALRGASNAVPAFSALRERARRVDREALQGAPLRGVLTELARKRPFLVIEGSDNGEVEARRESLLELTTALSVLESLRACAGPEDAGVQAEIGAAQELLRAAAAREHAAIERAR